MSEHIERFVDAFAEPDFIETNESFFSDYVDLRIRGYSSRNAFMQVFGTDHYPDAAQGYRRTSDIEQSTYYRIQFAEKLKLAKVSELWSDKHSVHELLCIARGDYVKDSTRLNAIKELNILVGITIVDENGKTKAGRSLSDFYKKEGVASNPPVEKVDDVEEAPEDVSEDA